MDHDPSPTSPLPGPKGWRYHGRVRPPFATEPGPGQYVPRSEYLQPAPGASRCEWEGTARYWTVSIAPVVLHAVGWSYDDPLPAFEAIRARLSFYPAQIECYVDGVRVRAQAGGFYGGWVTPELVGPFKGDPGTSGW